MKAIYLTNNLYHYERVYEKSIKDQIKNLFDIDDKCFTKDTLPSCMPDVEAIFSTWEMPVFTKEEITHIFPNLKAVFYSAGSVQFFARPFLELGIRVFSAWQANAVPVIEYAVAQILLATKGYFHLSSLSKTSYAKARSLYNIYPGNYNSKIGILGYGAIAKGVVKELIRHKLDIYVYAPNITLEEAKALGVNKSNSLDEIFSNCDVISNHIANLPSTLGMINKDLINKLRDYTTFINTGRGQQVDELALIEKLKSNPNINAVLDVTYPEPPEQNSMYFKLPNLIVTPHIAGSSGKEVVRMAEYMLNESKHFLNNEKCPFEVSLKMLETMA